jgi:hypothetical protein
MNKEIKISPELFGGKKNKTLKMPTGRQLKKELLQRLNKGSDFIQELDLLTKESEVKVELSEKPEPVLLPETKYSNLKNGSKPTFRQLKGPKTIKQFTSFGKKNDTVRVLIKKEEDYISVEKDIDKLKKHPMNKIRNYLRTRKLYKIGSTAPDEILRDIYVNANLTGEVENKSSDALIHNYLHDTIAI